MIDTVNIVYFSPTKTSEKIIKAIAKGIGKGNIKEFNITTVTDLENIIIPSDELTVFAAPVYGGRIPLVAKERIQKFKTKNSPAVLVAVFGNRHYDDALLELKDITEKQGFKTIAAGAFIGEHSFAIHGVEIAQNRPDGSDIEKARGFGRLIQEKISVDKIELELNISGNIPYREINPKPALAPETIESECNLCGTCFDVCPTNAISINGKVETKIETCIWCCACVKCCPQKARIFKNETLNKIQNMLVEKCQERREPEVFL